MYLDFSLCREAEIGNRNPEILWIPFIPDCGYLSCGYQPLSITYPVIRLLLIPCATRSSLNNTYIPDYRYDYINLSLRIWVIQR